ncbi:HAD hydrolase family protein [Myceligenerans salitolerans]|uniref:HAD hydrolase family protein n=1 Tax=Myceligenerans salitolerans TaxID=1230528 RepID=A0ABS3ICX4_9MICO|nr:HAD hydrolase family protein [Myceligenerans salitolerans]MBO0610881.1 HAD hydrolase family protein [Myceligenerans salitolerans]
MFVDIEGTLIQKGTDTVSAPTRRAVAATVAKGVTVALATQRPLVDALPIAEHLRLHKGGYIFASNGALGPVRTRGGTETR